MDRLIAPNTVDAAHADAAPASGTPGYATDGNPATGVPATLWPSYQYNAIQEELIAVIAAGGLTPNKSTLTQVRDAILALIQGSAKGIYAVRGLAGANNVTTPATKMDWSAAAATMINPTTGLCFTKLNIGTLTTDITVAGPARNGRDQAAAFTTNSFIHFYFIWNGTSVATIASANPPSTGPTLPAGDTNWAYIGAVFWGGSALPLMRVRGSSFAYASPINAVTSGSATSNTPVSLATLVPPNASQFELDSPNMAGIATSAGSFSMTTVVGVESGQDAFQFGLQGQGAASVTWGVSGSVKKFPNLSQGFNYRIANLGGTTGQSTTIRCTSYTMPNGDN